MTPSALPRRDFLGRLLLLVGGAAAFGRARKAEAAPQSIEPFVGELMIVPFGVVPTGWAPCDGQRLPIDQNQALFALLGTTFGGDGVTTFALPDLRGHVPIHAGQGPGLTNRVLGERGGSATRTLSIPEMPKHAHEVRGSNAPGSSEDPSGAYPATNAAGVPQWGVLANTALAAEAITTVGEGQAHENTAPSLSLIYVIALQGVTPSPSEPIVSGVLFGAGDLVLS